MYRGRGLLILVVTGLVCSVAECRNIGGFVTGWYLSPADVGEFADLVVHVRIQSSAPVVWRDMIWTETRGAVLGVWKGERPVADLVVRQAGGTVGDMTTEGGPRSDFVTGQEWILALDPIPGGDGYFTVIGFVQGAFEVRDGRARRDYSGMRFEDPPPPGALMGDLSESFDLERLREVMVGGGVIGKRAIAAAGTSLAAGMQSQGQSPGTRAASAGDGDRLGGGVSGVVEEAEPVEAAGLVKGEEGDTCGYTCIFRRHPILVFGVLGAVLAGVLVVGFLTRAQ